MRRNRSRPLFLAATALLLDHAAPACADPDPAAAASWEAQLPMDQIKRDQANQAQIHERIQQMGHDWGQAAQQQHELDSRHGLSRLRYIVRHGLWGQLIRDYPYLPVLVAILILSILRSIRRSGAR